MFLDKFEAKMTAVDGVACKPEESYHITLWSSGKVDRSLQGKTEEVKKEQILGIVATLSTYYGITPEEIGPAIEKLRSDLEKNRRKLSQ